MFFADFSTDFHDYCRVTRQIPESFIKKYRVVRKLDHLTSILYLYLRHPPINEKIKPVF